METFRYPIILYSQDGTRSFRVEALVDTGATYTWVPRPTLEALGHKAAFRRRLRLADGRVIEREGCEVQVEIDGARLTTPVIFGDPGSEVLLGAVTLEQFSLAPDPVTRRLVPVEALLMGVHPGGSCPKAVKTPEDLKGVSGTISAASPLGTGERKMGGVFAVIMAGGRGERLWPLSTPKKPKQFLKLLGRNTLLQETAARISGLIPKENIYVVTPKEFTKLVLEQLDLPKKNIVVEPVGRSTAPCVGLAAVMLESQDPQGVMVVLPADHVIKKTEEFLEVLKRAIEVASSGAHLVTLGIVPDHPATGYGYIRCGELFTKMGGVDVYKVQKFTEKPDEKAVKRFVEEGGYYWNSGMFVWRIDVILAAIERHLPKLHSGLMKIREHLGKPELDKVIEEVYREQESISIDYGVMEKAENVLVLPVEIGWSDVGDWSALAALLPADEKGNAVHAQHLGIETEDCVIYAEDVKRRVATLGVKGLVIVETGEAILVIPKSRVQEVRRLLERLPP